MSWTCINNVGIEDKFTKGGAYVIVAKDDMDGIACFQDDHGNSQSCFIDRFEMSNDVMDYSEPGASEDTCQCNSPPYMPPCSFCSKGGYCPNHDCYRMNCPEDCDYEE